MKEGTRRVAVLDQKRKWENKTFVVGAGRKGAEVRLQIQIQTVSKTAVKPCYVFSTGQQMTSSPSDWNCQRSEPNFMVRTMLPFPREGEDHHASQTLWKYGWLGPAPRNWSLGLSLKICILTSSQVTLMVSNPHFKEHSLRWDWKVMQPSFCLFPSFE